ncbi:MAG TPA: efflux RND transporter permease subunit [Burkholderiaceae bacterium]|nr:efflux RND transporter permease subunit [Burkholderiaceae bacterium]HQR70468.1 efflux RND transporter permease subunit [Burkholderiaceae bacterium]
MSHFFIDRPIFAWVVALVIMLAGALSIFRLPIAQYPGIAPPTITITATYPGASAATIEDTVTQIIEQRMTGLDRLRYIASTSDSAGTATITLTFDSGVDPDIAQVQVQNKLKLAEAQLPQVVQQQGVTVTKSVRNFIMVIGFVSQDGSMNRTDIADYIAANVQDAVSRVPGVGELTLFGAQYAMRIWLDPNKLLNYKLTPGDVAAAIRGQNAQIAAGQLGGLPAVQGQQLNATIAAQGRLRTPAQFEEVVLRTGASGATVRLRDVARVELGSDNYGFQSFYNGKPSSGLAVRLATNANALATADAVKAKVAELEAYFPPGLKAVVAYDTTPFIRLSIEEVVKTLVEAFVLVFLVMYLFLQNFRATLIPAIAVPVVLLGTLAVMLAFGFSINVLTMFGLVLAIGLLVDDAIVVVENVERLMSEEGLSPREATRKSMGQITGALVGIALVLAAVFIPMAFFGGSTGVIYRQFSITLAASMLLSVAVALILSPALCATLLKPVASGTHGSTHGLFGAFNRVFERGSNLYRRIVGRMLQAAGRWLVAYAVMLALAVFLLLRLPTSFLPDEDQGILFSQVVLPAGATQERTLAVLGEVQRHYLEDEKGTVEALFTVAGFSFSGTGQNAGIAFVRLKDWKERSGSQNSVQAVAGRAMRAFSGIRDALVFAFAPPAVLELGVANGFDMYLQDRSGQGHEALIAARNQLLGMAAKDPALVAVRPNGQEDTPQFSVDIDTAQAGALGLNVADINATLSAAWGSAYVDDFIDKGRVKRVYLQADAPYRMVPEDLDKWYVRNAQGEMVPFSMFARGRWTYGSPRLERFNGAPAVEIQGQAAPGRSSGEAMAAMERLAAQLPPGFGVAWTGLSYEERLSGAQAPLLYALSILVVFLCLAALYESWSIPIAVLLIVPLGVLGALAAAFARGLSDDVYFQVGLLTTIGLSAKNAILIIQFAQAQIASGAALIPATLEAVRLRLRPILMTSLAFGGGVLPLALARGAGSGSQNAIGTGVFGGMLAATFLGLLFVPLFFVVVKRLFRQDVPEPVEAAEGVSEGG